MGHEGYNLQDNMSCMYLQVGLSWQRSPLRGIVTCAHLEVMGGHVRQARPKAIAVKVYNERCYGDRAGASSPGSQV